MGGADRQRLLESARPYRPEQVAQDETEALRLHQVTADLKDLDRLAARVAHLRAVVAWADRLQQELGPVPAPPDRTRHRLSRRWRWPTGCWRSRRP